MANGPLMIARLRRMTTTFAAFVLLGACRGPLSALDPAGPAAGQIAVLAWGMFAGAVALTALMMVLFAMGFGRPRQVADRVWSHWLGVGFVLTVLTALVGWGLIVGEQQAVRGGDELRVQAHARQWQWQFTQPGPDGQPMTTIDELHIPAGQPVIVEITAQDVIHSFWVPRLAGKMDAIPGHTNRLRIQADAPGTYDGVCAEFCGRDHTTMRFQVHAYDTDTGMTP